MAPALPACSARERAGPSSGPSSHPRNRNGPDALAIEAPSTVRPEQVARLTLIVDIELGATCSDLDSLRSRKSRSVGEDRRGTHRRVDRHEEIETVTSVLVDDKHEAAVIAGQTTSTSIEKLTSCG